MDYLTSLAGAVCSLPLLYGTYRLAGNALDENFTRKYTVLQDIDRLAHSRNDGQRIKGTAVICGGR